MMIDWNLLLDTQGGPNHVNNFCLAPVIADIENQKVYFEWPYYFIAHFSKFVPVGSKRIASSVYTRDLQVVSFVTPTSEIVTVMLNETDKDIPVMLKDVVTSGIADFIIPKKSMMTTIY
jgi:glucosylceramidase